LKNKFILQSILLSIQQETVRPLQNAPFCPISASDSNFNPQNTQCIPVVKIIAFLELEQKYAFCKGLTVFPDQLAPLLSLSHATSEYNPGNRLR
jgi:hypothetical protein